MRFARSKSFHEQKRKAADRAVRLRPVLRADDVPN